MRFDALILCGGRGRRLNGADKAVLVVSQRSLLDRAVDAVMSASTTIAVGPRHETTREVVWTIEDPPGGGPVAAIAAGLDLVGEDVVVILGVDFPFVEELHVHRLLERIDGDGAIVADATGRHQFLVGAYRASALRRALMGKEPRDMAVKEVVDDLDLVVMDDLRVAQDCDTWADVSSADATLTVGGKRSPRRPAPGALDSRE